MRKTQNLLILLVILAMLVVPVIGVMAQDDETHNEMDSTEVVQEETADESHDQEAATDDHGSEEPEVPAGLTLGIFLAGLGAVAAVGAFAFNKERSAARDGV